MIIIVTCLGQQDNARYGHVVRHPIAKQTATTKLQLTVPVLHKKSYLSLGRLRLVLDGFSWFCGACRFACSSWVNIYRRVLLVTASGIFLESKMNTKHDSVCARYCFPGGKVRALVAEHQKPGRRRARRKWEVSAYQVASLLSHTDGQWYNDS